MQISPGDPPLQVSSSAFFTLALMLLILPLHWVVAIAVAVFFHEFCHYLAVRLCGGWVTGFFLGSRGMQMHLQPMAMWQELICALSGPVGGFILVLMARWMPRLAICAAIHSLYNLLPIYPLDGGRALCCILRFLFPGNGDVVCTWIGRICLIGIALVAIYASFWLNLGIVPVAAAAIIWMKAKIIPCKQVLLRVQ